MEFNETLRRRRSVREYTAQAVDEATLRRLIDAAIQAPNAVNEQPWTFTVVRDPGVLDRLSEAAKPHALASLPASYHAERLRPRLLDPAFHIFYHAPALVVISAGAPGPWIVEDCAMAAENLMLAAADAGLGTCWIGFAQAYLNTPEGRKMLGLPAASVPIAPIIVGHPKAVAAPVARKAPEIRWVG